jgi:uncharacterized alkaline shock family protein YloU
VADGTAAVTTKAQATATALPGRTTISGRAVAAVARRAASEVPGVELVSRSGLRQRLSGLLPGATPGGGVSAEVTSGTTAIELHLAVRWPEPVAAVSDEARRHVRATVEQLTGYAVRGVEIVVDALPEPSAGHGRVR